MKYKIRCSVCGQTFEDLEEAEFHAEHEHGEEVTLEFIEELKFDLEGFKHFEKKDYPFLYYKEHPNPVVYDSKTKKFYTSKDLREILSHPYSVTILTLLKYLEFKNRTDLKHQSEKTLEKLAKEDALSILVSQYFLNKDKRENLIKHYNGLMQRLIDTLEAKTDYCQLCGEKTFSYDSYLWDKLYVKKFELDKMHKITSPSNFFLTFVVNGKKTRVQALRLMHMLTKHRSLLKTAVELGLVDGIQDLLRAVEGAEEKEARKREEETLSTWLRTKVEKKPIHVKVEKEELTKEEEGVLKWLKARPKYQT